MKSCYLLSHHIDYFIAPALFILPCYFPFTDMKTYTLLLKNTPPNCHAENKILQTIEDARKTELENRTSGKAIKNILKVDLMFYNTLINRRVIRGDFDAAKVCIEILMLYLKNTIT